MNDTSDLAKEFIEEIGRCNAMLLKVVIDNNVEPPVLMGALTMILSGNVEGIQENMPQEYADGIAGSLEELAKALRERTPITTHSAVCPVWVPAKDVH